MGQVEYDACIAAGGSPATCQVHLGDALDSAIGFTLLNADGSPAGILRRNPTPGFGGLGELVLWISPTQVTTFTGGTFLVDTGEGTAFAFSLSPTGDILRSGTGRLPTADTATGSAPSFASTQAAQTQREAFEREQAERLAGARLAADKADREAVAEQNRLAEEAALKRGRLSTLTDLIQSFVASQAQARDTLANLQPDAFRFAAVAGGIAPFGVTPQQGFTEQLQQFAGAPVPTADPNASLPSIESAIQGLTGANVPLPPQTFGATPQGLAGGGTVPAPFTAMSARLVGEAGPEVMVTGPQGVTILPLGKGAQEGGFFPFQPIEFDRETLLPALGTSGIFGSLGFNQIPTASPRFGPGQVLTSPLSRLETLSSLGVRPSLVRDETGTFLQVTSEGIQHIGTAQQAQAAGFDLNNAVNLARNEIAQFGPSLPGVLTSNQPTIPTEQPSAFTRRPVPIIEPATGTLLPAPFTVASQLNQLRLTKPFLFNLLLSAYRAAGEPVEAVLGSIQAALPFGQERTLTGLG